MVGVEANRLEPLVGPSRKQPKGKNQSSVKSTTWAVGRTSLFRDSSLPRKALLLFFGPCDVPFLSAAQGVKQLQRTSYLTPDQVDPKTVRTLGAQTRGVKGHLGSRRREESSIRPPQRPWQRKRAGSARSRYHLNYAAFVPQEKRTTNPSRSSPSLRLLSKAMMCTCCVIFVVAP